MTPTPIDPVDETVKEVVNASGFLPHILQFLLIVGIGLVVAVILTFILSAIVRHSLKPLGMDQSLLKSSRLPFCATLASVVALSAYSLIFHGEPGFRAWQFAIIALLAIFLTWFVVDAVRLIEAIILARVERRVGPGRRLAKVRTQVGLLRRVLVAILCTVAVAVVLLTLPEVRALGAGLLASAGLVSVVVGLAVQSTLANVIAGLQVAFTDSIRVEDIVVVEGQRGTVEEITLSYVVVLLLDGRRLILPSTYFTTTPFENWSRTTTEIDGNVALQLKLNAPIDYLRQRSTELLESSDWWDGRTNDLYVTDVQNGLQTVTIYLSARNPGDLWSLRNMLREKLLAELGREYPDCLPDPRMIPGAPAA